MLGYIGKGQYFLIFRNQVTTEASGHDSLPIKKWILNNVKAPVPPCSLSKPRLKLVILCGLSITKKWGPILWLLMPFPSLDTRVS